jgi:carbamoyltransferase
MSSNNKDIYILSIYTGHNCTAALLKNGSIIGVVSEERFNRKKNYTGIPYESINWLLDSVNMKIEDMNLVAVVGLKYVMVDPMLNISTNKIFGLPAKIYGKLEFKLGKRHKPVAKIKNKLIDEPSGRRGIASFKKIMIDKYNISENKLVFVDHHECHAYAAYYGQTDEKEEAVVLTLDGEGDDSCATVSIAHGNEIKKIATTWRHHSLGYIYSITTKFLGMTPLEHEFKVMGLAPYAATKEQKYFMKTYNKVFKDIIWLDKKKPFNLR